MRREGRAIVEGRAVVARRARGPDGEVVAADLLPELARQHAVAIVGEAFAQARGRTGSVRRAALLAEQARGLRQPVALEGGALRGRAGDGATPGTGTGRPSRSSASWP